MFPKKLVIACVLALGVVCAAQTQQHIPTQAFNDARYIVGQGTTISGLGPASAAPQVMRIVTDGISPTDCTVGHGTWQTICFSNGTLWTAPLGTTATAYPGVGPDGANGLQVTGAVATGGSLGATFTTIGPSATPPVSWTLDTKTPLTAFNSIAAQGGTVAGPLGFTGRGLLDWNDTTATCAVNRGVVNVRDCGAVADGAWVSGGCGQTAPVGCWTGTDNYTAIHKAKVAVANAGGGTIYFPPSGTNIWMVGAPSECTDAIAGNSSSQNALFALANGTELVGSGKYVTTIMALPGGYSTACWMFGNSVVPSYGVKIHDLRIDGNEGTSVSHNDTLHPNNGGTSTSSVGGQLGAININPGTLSSQPTLDVAAIDLYKTQITGFTGVAISSAAIPTGSQFVIWAGPYGFVRVTDNDIYYNQWAGAIFTQTPDSLWKSNYMVNDNMWTAGPQVVELQTNTARWEGNYWGGGFGANYVGLGVTNATFVNNINDDPGPGLTCTSTVFGCGSNYIFADNVSVYSTGNQIIGGTASDTYTGYPAILFAQHSTNNVVIGVNFNNSGDGNLPTYLVQESGSASNTVIVSPAINETPATGKYSLLNPGPVVDVAGLILTNSSTPLSRYAKYTASLSPSAVAAGTCAAQSVTVTGVQAADIVMKAQKPTEQAGLALTSARTTAANTVSLNFCNNTLSPITPTASETYTFVVVQ